MLYHKSFAIAILIVALALFSSVGYSELCNKPSDIDSGFGENTGAFGHAEVVELGWWDGYSSTTQWGYVTNHGAENVVYSIRFEYRVVELTKRHTFRQQLYVAPIQVVTGQLEPDETASSTFTNGYYYDERWARGRILRAEARTVVSADEDEWEATGCVDIEF